MLGWANILRVCCVCCVGAVVAGAAGCNWDTSSNPNTYWYCWDTGAAEPHHLGHPVSGDHLCTQSELKQAWGASSSTTSAASALPTTPDTTSTLSTTPHRRSFCSTHQCIPNFWNGTGSIVQCVYGEWSHSGGERGACSGYGGVASASGGSGPVPTTPEQASPPTPQVPPSHPYLAGLASASSKDYSVTITRVRPDHSLDAPGVGGPPMFGIDLFANCAEPPGSAADWQMNVAGDPTGGSVGLCASGTFDSGGMPTPVTVSGCGSHIVAFVPESMGNSPTDVTLHPVAQPMRFSIHVC